MAEKINPATEGVSFNEQNGAPPTENYQAETGARRGSIAMNIVQNPLTVSPALKPPVAVEPIVLTRTPHTA